MSEPTMVLGISRPTARYLANFANGRSIFPGSLSGCFAATPVVIYHAVGTTSTLRLAGGPIVECGDRLVDIGLAVGERDERGLELRRRPVKAAGQHAMEKPREALPVGAARLVGVAHAPHPEKERQHRSLAIDDARDMPQLEHTFQSALESRAQLFEPFVDARTRERLRHGKPGGDRHRIAGKRSRVRASTNGSKS